MQFMLSFNKGSSSNFEIWIVIGVENESGHANVDIW